MLVRFPLVWFLASLLCFPCHGATEFSAGSEVFAIPFRTQASLMVVPVMVNGSGPYDFALDTGSSASAIDPRLAKKLALRSSGKSIVELGIKEISDRRLVHVDTLSVGKGTIASLDLILRASMNGTGSRISGMLGKDYLRNFDLVIDNQHHVVLFDPNSGTLALELQGEHLEVATNGIYRGGKTRNRVILKGHSDEFGSATFLVDSGVNNLIVLLPQSKWRLLGFPSTSLITDASGRTKETTGRTQFVRTLSFGEKHLMNLVAFALSSQDEADVDAFIPTRMFHRIFICHSDNYVILDPTPKRR